MFRGEVGSRFDYINVFVDDNKRRNFSFRYCWMNISAAQESKYLEIVIVF